MMSTQLAVFLSDCPSFSTIELSPHEDMTLNEPRFGSHPGLLPSPVCARPWVTYSCLVWSTHNILCKGFKKNVGKNVKFPVLTGTNGFRLSD